MTINFATTTGGYAAVKQEAATNNANVFIDTKNFDQVGHSGHTIKL